MATVGRYGARHGIDVTQSRENLLALRKDAGLSALMAGELAQESSGILTRGIGRAPTSGELYVAHFLGPRDAVALIRAAEAGEGIPQTASFARAAAANPSIFADASDAQALLRQLTKDHPSKTDASPALPPRSATSAPTESTAAMALARLAGAELGSSLISALLDLQSGDIDRGEA